MCLYISVQSLGRVQLICSPMDCSSPGFPVHHQLPELAQTHVHQVGDAIQPSHHTHTHTHIYFYIYMYTHTHTYGLPRWFSGKEPACQCTRHGLNPWVRKIPWRRKWQSIPVFLPRKSHGQRGLAWDHKRVSYDLAIKQHPTHTYICLCVSQIAF